MRFNRSAVVLTSAAATLFLLAVPAFAHVTVQGPGATQGGYTKLTFRVPTEKDVPTTKIEIQFPTDAPLAAARVKPHTGWKAEIKKAKPATPLKDDEGNAIEQIVSSITWTATGPGIGATEFDEFEVSAGPLPKKDEMVFKALQTYSDGEVVRWIETTEDADHPAPVLKLAKAGADAHSGGTPTSSAAPVSAVNVSADSDEDGEALGFGALSVAVLALVLGIGAFVRSGRRSA